MAVTIQNSLDAPFDLAAVVGDARVLMGTAAPCRYAKRIELEWLTGKLIRLANEDAAPVR